MTRSSAGATLPSVKFSKGLLDRIRVHPLDIDTIEIPLRRYVLWRGAEPPFRSAISSRCSLSRRPGAAFARTDARVALRTASRDAPQVVAVQLDQVEGVEEDEGVVAAVADAVESALLCRRSTPPRRR